jgi:23S rRNA (adenine2503-C2)-methyltransferase
MAVANKYTLRDIFNAVDNYQRITRRRVTFEYCMIKGLNDQDGHANAVARLLRGINAGVNLIEYNPCNGNALEPSSRDRIQQFKDILTRHGLETIVRYKRGQSIKAACGQLAAGYLEPERE